MYFSSGMCDEINVLLHLTQTTKSNFSRNSSKLMFSINSAFHIIVECESSMNFATAVSAKNCLYFNSQQISYFSNLDHRKAPQNTHFQLTTEYTKISVFMYTSKHGFSDYTPARE